MTETWVCPACGAPVPVTRRGCAYCGAVLERVVEPRPGARAAASSLASAVRTFCPDCGTLYPADAATCPRCPPFVPGAGEGRRVAPRCPACGTSLGETALGPVRVDRCGGCGGLWFDRGEVARVLDLRTRGGLDRAAAAALEDRLAPGVPPRDRRPGLACVRCRGRMTRKLVAAKGPAYVDACRRHGLWFDAGEWEAFTAFVESGGLEVERHRADQGIRPIPHPRHVSDDGPELRLLYRLLD